MRIGLFGGAFDPIHIGHLILAETCRETLKLDKVLFIVAGDPPHKRGEVAPAEDRLEMVRLAIAGNSAFEASELEIDRPGPHYSVDTVLLVRERHPDDELFFLVGGDVLPELPTWKTPERIRELAALVAVNRAGSGGPSGAASPFVHESVSIPAIGIASTAIRARIAGNQSIRYLVPRGVEAYIRERGLYRRAS